MHTYIHRVARYLYKPWVIPLLVFVCFLAASWLFYGPAYLSDEVSYLNKAATLSGQTVNIASSWFAGYPILISPAYFLSHNPYVEWRIVLGLNALMWAGSAALLRYILRRLRPRTSEHDIAVATIGAMLYPSWLAMSGYAFATTGFVVIFMGSIAALVASKLRHTGWLALSAALAGYAYWVHPLGAIYVVLLSVLVILIGVLQKRWQLLSLPVLAGAIAESYNLFVAPYFNSVMSSDTVNDSHYTSSLHQLVVGLLSPDYFERFALLVIGLIFAVVVSSLGLIVFVYVDYWKKWRESTLSLSKRLLSVELVIPVFLMVVLIAVLTFNALSSADNQLLRLDEWVYGRYTDMFLLPLLGLAILCVWKKRTVILASGYVFGAGLLLWLCTSEGNTYLRSNNWGNIQGLWPVVLGRGLHHENYLVWAAFGAAGVLLCLLAARKESRKYLWVLLLPILIADFGNLYYHRQILTSHSTASSLYTYVRDNYNENDCIGFTPDTDSQERFSLYSYYLHGYDVEQMTIAQWNARNCQGPYFTYNASDAQQPGLYITGIETNTHLLMITRGSVQSSVINFN